MENWVDYTINILVILFFLKGVLQGFFKSILGPISLLLASILSYFYYIKTSNVMLSLIIGFIGPFAIQIILSILAKTWNITVKGGKISPVSRLLGGAFSTLWSGTMMFLLLTITLLIPFNFAKLNNIQLDIRNSKTYQLIARTVGFNLPPSKSEVNVMASILKSPEQAKEIQSSQEYQDIMKHEKIREIFSDKETVEQIQNRDFAKLLTNKHIQAIMNDKEVLNDLMALNKVIIREKIGLEDIQK